MPAISTESLYGGVYLAQDGSLDPHAATHAVADAARGARRPDPDRIPGDRLRARPAPGGAARPDRGRPDRHRARRRRRRDLGAAGGGHGRRLHPVDAGRSPARRVAGRARPRAAARHALLPRSRQPRLRQERARRHALRRLRGGADGSLGRRRPVGSRRHVAAARLRALRAAHGRCDPALPVPRRRRGDPAGLPPRRDDPRREPAPRADARRARLLGRRRPVAQRIRRRRRDRPGARRLDHGRRPGRRHRALPGLAVRGTVPRPDVGRRPWRARPTPTTTGCATRTTPTRPVGRGGCPPLHGRLQEAGAVFGIEGRLGAGGPASARRAVAARRARPARLRLDDRRRGSSGSATEVARRPRAGRDHRPELVRQDRGRRAGRASACSSGSPPTTSTDRSAASSTGRSSTSAAGWSPTSPSPGSGRRHFRVVTGAGFVGTEMGWLRGAPARRRPAGRRSATTSDDGRASGCGARPPATSSARRRTARWTTRRLPLRRATPIRVGPAAVLAARISATPASSAGSSRRPGMGRRGLGPARRRRPRPAVSSRSATGRSTCSAWRRATATTAPT